MNTNKAFNIIFNLYKNIIIVSPVVGSLYGIYKDEYDYFEAQKDNQFYTRRPIESFLNYSMIGLFGGIFCPVVIPCCILYFGSLHTIRQIAHDHVYSKDVIQT